MTASSTAQLLAADPGAGGWIPWVGAGLVATALAILVVVVVLPSLQSRRQRRLASIAAYVGGPRAHKEASPGGRRTALTEQLVSLGERYMRQRSSTRGTMALIARADLPLRAGEWLLLRVAAVGLGAVGGSLILQSSLPLGALAGIVGGGVVGLVLPSFVLRRLAARRANAFEKVLPDVLTLVATSLRSGFGLGQALDAVARDAAQPVAKEFARALAEGRIGTDLSDALEHMAVRMDSTSMRWVVMAIRIQRDVGGNLADTLQTTAATLKERESLHRQVRTLSAEGRLSAYILIALPIGVFLYLLAVNHDYVSRLWLEPLGLIMLVFGIAMLFLGMFWMTRVVRIEV